MDLIAGEGISVVRILCGKTIVDHLSQSAAMQLCHNGKCGKCRHGIKSRALCGEVAVGTAAPAG